MRLWSPVTARIVENGVYWGFGVKSDVGIHNNRFAVVNNFKQLARWPAPGSIRLRGARPEVANYCPVEPVAGLLSCRDVGCEVLRARREAALLHYDRRSDLLPQKCCVAARLGQRCNPSMVSMARSGCESLGSNVS